MLNLKNTTLSESTRLMLIVNLASAHMHNDDKDLAMKVLDSVDWSASSDNYRICVAAIRGDVDDVIRLMDNVTTSKTVKKEDFREWPVFSFIRSDEKFQAKFASHFDEPLFDPTGEATTFENEENAVKISDANDEALH